MRIARVERVRAEALRGPERAALREQLIDIVMGSFEGPPREVAAKATIFRGPEAELLIYYDADDEPLGFSSNIIESHEIEGRPLGVMDNGTFMKPGFRGGGARAAVHSLLFFARFKLARPRAPVCFIGQASTPVMYRLVLRYFDGVHPRPGVPEPPELTELVRTIMARRGYALVDDDPWRVSMGAQVSLRDEGRMRSFVERSDSPAVRFYLERTPGAFEGEWLTVYIPLDMREIAKASLRVLGSFVLGHRRV